METDITAPLSALSHPGRLEVFRLLMRRYPQSVRAGEIAQALETRPSTVSAYLAALMQAGLITQRRESTTLLYRAALGPLRAMVGEFLETSCAGRVDLVPPAAQFPQARRLGLLFIGQGNAARSLMAEALLRARGADRFHAYSAGVAPAEAPSPHALDVLRAHGVEAGRLVPRGLAEFADRAAVQIDIVITLSDAAATALRGPWPGGPVRSHWGLADPARAEGTGAERRGVFEAAFEQIEGRIAKLAALPVGTLGRGALQQALDEIGA